MIRIHPLAKPVGYSQMKVPASSDENNRDIVTKEKPLPKNV
jgi:hypothetical protein